MIYGQTSDKFCLLTSCDSKYLLDHARSFVASAALANNNIHLHIIHPSVDDNIYLDKLKIAYSTIYPQGIFTSSYDNIDIKRYDKEQRKTFYSCNRFLVAPTIIKSNCLILDIDSLIIEHINEFTADVGLVLRPDNNYKDWNGLAGKVAAGAVYININHIDFLDYTKKFIETNELKWFVDQVALLKSYENFPNKKYHAIDNKFLDWEFKKGTPIWTGKGPSKYQNKTYTDKVKHFNKQISL